MKTFKQFISEATIKDATISSRDLVEILKRFWLSHDATEEQTEEYIKKFLTFIQHQREDFKKNVKFKIINLRFIFFYNIHNIVPSQNGFSFWDPKEGSKNDYKWPITFRSVWKEIYRAAGLGAFTDENV